MSWTEDLRRILESLRKEPPKGQPPGGIPCDEAAERIFEWLDSELDQAEAKSVGEHLETCARCYPRLAFERAFREAMRRPPRGEMATAELRQRIIHELKEEGSDTD